MQGNIRFYLSYKLKQLFLSLRDWQIKHISIGVVSVPGVNIAINLHSPVLENGT